MRETCRKESEREPQRNLGHFADFSCLFLFIPNAAGPSGKFFPRSYHHPNDLAYQWRAVLWRSSSAKTSTWGWPSGVTRSNCCAHIWLLKVSVYSFIISRNNAVINSHYFPQTTHLQPSFVPSSLTHLCIWLWSQRSVRNWTHTLVTPCPSCERLLGHAQWPAFARAGKSDACWSLMHVSKC